VLTGLALSLGAARAMAAPQEPTVAGTPTVAVMYFDYEGKKDELAVLKKGLAQMLISDLGALDRCRLVERSRLEALLEEQKLGQTGKLDRATSARVGKLLGARLMVLGGFFDMGTALRVDARVVDVETGKIVGAVGATGKNDDFLDVEQRLSVDLQKVLARQVETASTATTPAPRRPRPARPARLKTGTAVKYSEALASADKGDKKTAQARLRVVLDEQPDFLLARADLERLMQ
jgi:curli biogenesis system outer membrane secretion channel CsgG